MKKVIYLFLVFTIINGCGSLRRYSLLKVNKDCSKTERKTTKSYELGKTNYVNVGEEIVSVRDYYSSACEFPKMKANNDFLIHGGNVNGTGLDVDLMGRQGDEFDIWAETMYQNKKVFILKISGLQSKDEPINIDECKWCAMVYTDGTVINRVMSNIRTVQPGKMTITPSGLEFERVKGEDIDYEKAYIHQDLIYSGMQGEGFAITYREYTKDGLARPAFYQNLTYNLNDSIIQFRKFKIEILEATNKGIEFIVKEDGL